MATKLDTLKNEVTDNASAMYPPCSYVVLVSIKLRAKSPRYRAYVPATTHQIFSSLRLFIPSHRLPKAVSVSFNLPTAVSITTATIMLKKYMAIAMSLAKSKFPWVIILQP